MHSTTRQPRRQRPALLRGGRRLIGLLLLGTAAAVVTGAGVAQDKAAPVRVTNKDEQAVLFEPVMSALPVDPQRRINFQPQGLLATVMTENNQTLHLGTSAVVNINGQVF